MSALKIGLMSFAHLHGAGYLSILAGRPDVEVRVADVDPERGKRFAEQHGVDFAESYDDLMGWDPDGVIVCSENALHRELVELGASGGAYVLCEKPLATSLEDGHAMIAACEAAGVGLMTAFPMRFSQPIMALEQLVRGGELGRIFGVAGTNPGNNPGLRFPWFVTKDLAGGGAVMDHTVHVADLLRWLLEAEAV
ncbi:MAG TPA: Gfo/Idh/MocA family oxidoreductase, partial [Actinopolymorphaceae bacterium]